LSAHARTRTIARPGAGTGSGASSNRRTSSPPCWWNRTAFNCELPNCRLLNCQLPNCRLLPTANCRLPT